MTRLFRAALMPAMAASLMFVGCARTDRAADGTTETRAAAAEREREEYITRMEGRAAQLEQRLSTMEAQAGTRTANRERLQSIQRDVKDLRQEISDLRTTRGDNWWPATERSIERSRKELEDDVNRFGGTADRARTAPRDTTADMSPSTPAGETTHDQSAFAGQRDRFVTRMEADIDALERDLDRMATAGRRTATGAVDDVRDQLKELREQVRDLRNVSDENNWWDATKKRLDRTAERIEQSIENMGRDNDQRP